MEIMALVGDGKKPGASIEAARKKLAKKKSQRGCKGCPGGKTCEELWAAIKKEVDKVFEMKDPIMRNRKISAAYAAAYLKNPKLQWAGTAAFASKQIGCEMRTWAERAQDAAKLAEGNPEDDMQWLDPAAAQAADGMRGVMRLGSMGMEHAVEKFAEGNGKVFQEIYPVFLFYTRHGEKRFGECLSHCPPPGIHPKLQDAFARIAKGELKGAAFDTGKYEQEDNLQHAVFDDLLVKAGIKGEQVFKVPLSLQFSSGCSVSNPAFLSKFNPSKGNFYDAAPRVDFAVQSIGHFIDLSTTSAPDYMRRQLDQIVADGGGDPFLETSKAASSKP